MPFPLLLTVRVGWDGDAINAVTPEKELFHSRPEAHAGHRVDFLHALAFVDDGKRRPFLRAIGTEHFARNLGLGSVEAHAALSLRKSIAAVTRFLRAGNGCSSVHVIS